MSTRDIDTLKDELLKNRIELSDTLSQFMEKCNNNFSAIIEWGGGPAGVEGEKGDPGAPTKPKVPIHVWREDKEYSTEIEISDDKFEITDWIEDLSQNKYQEGHLIMLKNGHVYILEINNEFGYSLKPTYLLALQSYDPDSIVNGKSAYVHIAYADDPNADGNESGFITDEELRSEKSNTEQISTFALLRSGNSNIANKPYIGIYSDDKELSSTSISRYTWIKIQGPKGEVGEKGETGATGATGATGPQGIRGEKGDGYKGHPYIIE